MERKQKTDQEINQKTNQEEEMAGGQNTDTQRKKHRRNDLILAGVIAVAAVLYFLWRTLAPAEAGAEVVVELRGQEYARLPLSQDTELDIVYGRNHNRLVIKDGVATMAEATCPDGLCVHQPDISLNGQMIVCLPNQVLITIENGEDSGLDGMAK